MNELERLVKKYVGQHAQYQEANRFVLKHKQLQEKIKELFAQQRIDQLAVAGDSYTATLSFRPVKSMRVDTALIPEDMRARFMREYVSRREHLDIRKT